MIGYTVKEGTLELLVSYFSLSIIRVLEIKDNGALGHYIFSVSKIRDIVGERTLELLDITYSPLA